MKAEQVSKEEIFLAVLNLFEEKGTHFTTLELAKELKTSKRTLYAQFHGKEDILEETIDYVFLHILESDHKILANESFSIQQRVGLFLHNLPKIGNIGALVLQLEDLKKCNPKLKNKVENYLDGIWEEFIIFLERGMRQNEIEQIDTKILRMMLQELLKKLLKVQSAKDSEYDFQTALGFVNQVLLYGIYKR